jgi:hypothetical protein
LQKNAVQETRQSQHNQHSVPEIMVVGVALLKSRIMTAKQFFHIAESLIQIPKIELGLNQRGGKFDFFDNRVIVANI